MDLGDPTGWTDRERAFFAAGWNDCVEKQPGEVARLRAAVDAATMARTRLDDFADKANAGLVHHDGREWKRRIWAAFSDFDAYQQKEASDAG